MQVLKELTHIVTKEKVRALELLGFPFSRDDSQARALYMKILGEEFESDEMAAQALFGTDKPESNYRKLKSDLFKRLVNALFFINIKKSKYNTRQLAYHECYKNWAASKILSGKNAKESSIFLTQKVLKYAEEFEFTHLCMDACKALRLHYGSIIGDSKLYEEYNQKYKDYAALYHQESIAEEYYTDLVIEHIKNKSLKSNVKEKAIQYYDALKPALRQWSSHDLHFYGNLIRLIIYTSVNDYKNAISVCEEAIRFFDRKIYTARMPLIGFNYQKIICNIQLREFDEKDSSLHLMKKAKFLEEGTYNWYKFQEVYIILRLHTQRYQAAFDIYSAAVRHKRFQYLPPDRQEYWKILEKYLHYLALVNKIEPTGNKEYFSKFRLGRFLNETPIFSKDKKGVNIAILIIQILFLMQQNRWSETVDRIDSIEKYAERYLHNNYTIRAYYFIKMLLLLPKNQFHREAITRKTTQYLQQLKSHSPEFSTESSHVEIIPFEDMWDMLLENLGRQFVNVPSN